MSRIEVWRIRAQANGAIVAIPEIADYEVRRGLCWPVAGRASSGLRTCGESSGLHRDHNGLDAESRRTPGRRATKGRATAEDKEIDGDVILAAQAMLFSGINDDLTVATYNERHLSRYVRARHWEDIEPDRYARRSLAGTNLGGRSLPPLARAFTTRCLLAHREQFGDRHILSVSSPPAAARPERTDRRSESSP